MTKEDKREVVLASRELNYDVAEVHVRTRQGDPRHARSRGGKRCCGYCAIAAL